jgi:Flp pilus assembly protein TadD
MSKKYSLHNSKIKTSTDSDSKWKPKTILGIFIAIFAFILYSQSISFNYVLDDYNVLKENKLTTKGIAAIPQIFKSDRLYGFSNEVRSPEYRPIPMALFAIEWQLFPDNPHFGHFINVMLYAITCGLLFLLLCNLFEASSYGIFLPFICALLFAAHPIHTEVVDNIKSLDEILCLLFGISSIIFLLNYLRTHSKLSLAVFIIFYFMSLLSKETAIAFLPLFPLFIYVFTTTKINKILMIALIMGIITGIYFYIRWLVLSPLSASYSIDVYNNSLLAAPDYFSEKATAFYILLKYIFLLMLPHPLSYDYSYSQIPISKFTDLIPLLSLIIYFGLIIYSIINIRKKNLFALAILIYLITLLPVSNLFLLIGWTMAERFLFMPSLGYCLVISLILFKLTKTDFINNKYFPINQLIKSNSKLTIIVVIIVGLYSIKTFSRNADWKDNATLFEHDVVVVDNSARAHYNLGNTLFTEIYPKEKDSYKQNIILDRAKDEFMKSIAIYKFYSEPYLGVALIDTKREYYKDAIANYKLAWEYMYDKTDPEIFYNLSLIYKNLGQFNDALAYADSSIKLNPKDYNGYNNKGCALVGLKKYTLAIPEFQRSIDLNPKFIWAYKNIGACYVNTNQNQTAIKYLKTAESLDSNDVECIQYLSIAYQNTGDTVSANLYSQKANRLNNSQPK